MTDPHQLVADTVLRPDFVRATFGGAARHAPSEWQRVVVRPVEVRGERHLQFAYFDGRKTVTKNHPPAEAAAPLAELVAVGFAGVHLTTRTEEIDVRTTKKGKVSVGRRAGQRPAPPETGHNRVKDVPLPEGRENKLLEAMGIVTRDGRVRPTMRAKFTQINEFLKHLLHTLDDSGLKAAGRPLDILDCGCGSSYLTLAAHHYLNEVLGVPARVLGVDVNEEVIRKSVGRAERAGAGGLRFACGTIGGVDSPADIVFALHACDTATDDALAQAVRGGAKLVLCVPCCHHALNKDLKSDGVLKPVLRHGILRERAADLVTDAFRALALRIAGYRVDVVEFVSPEHTARNLMIRAVRAPRRAGSPDAEPAARGEWTGKPGDAELVAEYRGMKQFWGVTPHIERALGDRFVAKVGAGEPHDERQ
jgi:SAM-dependent methyltransferase